MLRIGTQVRLTVHVTTGIWFVASSLAVTMFLPQALGQVSPVLLVQFNGTNGYNPQGPLIYGADGKLYGTTYGGFVSNGGTIFRLDPNTGEFTNLLVLDPLRISQDGFGPMGQLAQGADGNIYGTTHGGGTNNAGTLFRISPSGAFTVLASFGAGGGSIPRGGLARSRDMTLYGTTYFGGSNGGGTVFSFSTNGQISILARLSQTNAWISAPVVEGADGDLYGTTDLAGDYGKGSIFQLKPDGIFTTVASFNGTNGSSPNGGLIQARDGSFYGTTIGGGAYSQGTVFKMTVTGVVGTVTSLVSFDGTNAGCPLGGVIEAEDGFFYGTTSLRGTENRGTLFRMSPDGELTILYSFPNSAVGGDPWTALVQDANGAVWGTTGGCAGPGGVFVYDPNWPVIVEQPAGQTNAAGTTASFRVTALGTAPLIYQWRKDGTNLADDLHISGATSSNLIVESVSAADAGVYSVVVRHSFGVAVSTGAVLTLAQAPTVLVPPASQTNYADWTASFKVTAAGIPAPSLQWRKNGVDLANGGTISGATNSTLMVGPLSASDAGTYSVLLSNAAGIMITGAVLTVSTELLRNGSFETGDFSGWDLADSSGSPMVGTNYSHFGRAGAELRWTYDWDNGQLSYTYLSQSLATTPGANYLLSFWLKGPMRLTPTEFLVAWNTNAASTNVIFDQLDIGGFDWTYAQFLVTASEPTTTLTFGFMNQDEFVLDDVVVVPAPAAGPPLPQFSDLTFSRHWGARFEVSLNPGAVYRLQASTNLLNWETLTNFISGTNCLSYRDPEAALHPMRFYRVVSP